MESSEESIFDQAMARYKSGENASNLLKDFKLITATAPNHGAGWTCLSWLQLLSNENEEALRSARIAVKLSPQDPQSRINLSLALLENQAKGVREHIEFVQRAILILPELEKELKESIEDGLVRKRDWKALLKIKNWLSL